MSGQLDTPALIIIGLNEVVSRSEAETAFPNQGFRTINLTNQHELAYRNSSGTVIYFPSEDRLTASGGDFIGVNAAGVTATNLNLALAEIVTAGGGTNLTEGTTTLISVNVDSSTGGNATLSQADLNRAGVLSTVKYAEIVANTAKVGYTETLVTNNPSVVANTTGIATNAQDLVDHENDTNNPHSTNFQDIYDASTTNPQITTDSSNGPVRIKNNAADDTAKVLTIKNKANAVTAYIDGSGKITSQTLDVGGAAELGPTEMLSAKITSVGSYTPQTLLAVDSTGRVTDGGSLSGGQVDSVVGGTNINITTPGVNPTVNLDASISNAITSNTTNIATNATNIASNDTDIATNATDIAANTTLANSKVASVTGGTNVTITGTATNPIINSTSVTPSISLQDAYDDSTTPEITTDATRGAVSIKRGSALDADNVLEVQDGTGANTFRVTGEGFAYGIVYTVLSGGQLRLNGAGLSSISLNADGTNQGNIQADEDAVTILHPTKVILGATTIEASGNLEVIGDTNVDQLVTSGTTQIGGSLNVLGTATNLSYDLNVTGAINGGGAAGTFLNGSGGYTAPSGIAPRVKTDGSTATLNIDASITDQFNVTAQSTALTIAAPTNPTDGQKLTIRIKDNGTTRTLVWNAIFRALGTTLPTNTTANKTIYVGCIYNSNDTRWDVVAVSEEA